MNCVKWALYLYSTGTVLYTKWIDFFNLWERLEIRILKKWKALNCNRCCIQQELKMNFEKQISVLNARQKVLFLCKLDIHGSSKLFKIYLDLW